MKVDGILVRGGEEDVPHLLTRNRKEDPIFGVLEVYTVVGKVVDAEKRL